MKTSTQKPFETHAMTTHVTTKTSINVGHRRLTHFGCISKWLRFLSCGRLIHITTVLAFTRWLKWGNNVALLDRLVSVCFHPFECLCYKNVQWRLGFRHYVRCRRHFVQCRELGVLSALFIKKGGHQIVIHVLVGWNLFRLGNRVRPRNCWQ